MFKFLKILFGIDYLIDGGTKVITQKDNTMTAQIVPTATGGANLVTRNGIVATYARARDARRGALRRGLTLA
jgi:hypothetical protein